MDGPRDYYTKLSKAGRERRISWYHLYVKSKKRKMIQMNLFTKQGQLSSLAMNTVRKNVVRGSDRDTDKGIFKTGRICPRKREDMKVLERERVVVGWSVGGRVSQSMEEGRVPWRWGSPSSESTEDEERGWRGGPWRSALSFPNICWICTNSTLWARELLLRRYMHATETSSHWNLSKSFSKGEPVLAAGGRWEVRFLAPWVSFI